MKREIALADLIPLWRTLREQGVTALVTPALDYVGGLELGSLDVRYAGDEQIASIGEGLRSFVGSLEDETTLHFLYRVERRADEDIREYESSCAYAAGAALRSYVDGRAAWLRRQRLRGTHVYLFLGARGHEARRRSWAPRRPGSPSSSSRSRRASVSASCSR